MQKGKEVKELGFNEVLQKCASLCSKAEYAVFDIKKRLSKWNISEDEQQEIIEYLCDNDYINEERYICAYVHEKFNLSKWGRIKIRHALRKKNLPNQTIFNALDEIDEEIYYNTLLNIVNYKAKSITKNTLTLKEKASVYNYALSKGYEPDLIEKAIKDFSMKKNENKRDY